MTDRKKCWIPKSVVSRYSGYLMVLQSLRESGETWVSSQELADMLDHTSSTVRQDLSHLSFTGRSKRGYEIEGLKKEISGVLGLDAVWNVTVVGAGNLGCALAQHQDFAKSGFNICGIFDSDIQKVGKSVGKLITEDFANIRPFVRDKKVSMGILAVPDVAAQSVADELVAAGVKGILNFTSAHIVVPDDISCVDARVVACLHELSHSVAGMIIRG